jgi:hypothetical protein
MATEPETKTEPLNEQQGARETAPAAKPVSAAPIVGVDQWAESRRWSVAIYGSGGRVDDQARAALLHDLFEVARSLGKEGAAWLNKLYVYFEESEASCSEKFKKLRKWIDLKREHKGHEPRVDRLRGSN